jgi:hypothetical protein
MQHSAASVIRLIVITAEGHVFYYYAECHSAQCHYAECRGTLFFLSFSKRFQHIGKVWRKNITETVVFLALDSYDKKLDT